jgi:hypothetical protein
MIKLLLAIALVLLITVDATGSCSANCPGCSFYVTWNVEIINNGGNACSSFSSPSTPSGYNKITGVANAGNIRRKLLSHYTHSSSSSCKIYCPPGSYLTKSSSALLYCQRDPAYYSGYLSKCIPHFE